MAPQSARAQSVYFFRLSTSGPLDTCETTPQNTYYLSEREAFRTAHDLRAFLFDVRLHGASSLWLPLKDSSRLTPFVPDLNSILFPLNSFHFLGLA